MRRVLTDVGQIAARSGCCWIHSSSSVTPCALSASSEGRSSTPEFPDAETARAVDGLAHDIARSLGAPVFVFFVRCRAQINPRALDIFREERVEFGLIVEEMPVGFVVHPRDDAVGHGARDDGFTLRGREPVHFGDLIVHVARAVFDGAVEHVVQQPHAGFARLFVQHFSRLPHFMPVLSGARAGSAKPEPRHVVFLLWR